MAIPASELRLRCLEGFGKGIFFRYNNSVIPYLRNIIPCVGLSANFFPAIAVNTGGETHLFRFQQATTADEMDFLYRFRYQAYCLEKSFLPAEDYPTGRESDEYDPCSAHFYACDEDKPYEIAGYFRLILFNERGFPCENHFDLHKRSPEPQRTVELSRLIVAPEYREHWRVILMGMVREMYLFSLHHTVTQCYAVLEKPLMLLLRRIGIRFEIIGEDRWYFNTPNSPALLDAAQFTQDLLSGAKRFSDFVEVPVPPFAEAGEEGAVSKIH